MTIIGARIPRRDRVFTPRTRSGRQRYCATRGPPDAKSREQLSSGRLVSHTELGSNFGAYVPPSSKMSEIYVGPEDGSGLHRVVAFAPLNGVYVVSGRPKTYLVRLTEYETPRESTLHSVDVKSHLAPPGRGNRTSLGASGGRSRSSRRATPAVVAHLRLAERWELAAKCGEGARRRGHQR